MLCRFNKEKRVYMSVLFNAKIYVYLVYGTDLVLLLLCLLTYFLIFYNPHMRGFP